MRRIFDACSQSARSCQYPCWVACIINMYEFEFSAGTGSKKLLLVGSAPLQIERLRMRREPFSSSRMRKNDEFSARHYIVE